MTSAVTHADHRKPLSFLVAANRLRRDGQVRITVPFSADIEPGGMPVRITEVREQSASWTSLLDERKTGVINLANVLVDPTEIEWRPVDAHQLQIVAEQEAKREEEPVITEVAKREPQKVGWELAQKGLRRCSRCKQDKSLVEFSKTASYCRPCTRLISEERRNKTAIPIKRSLKGKASRKAKAIPVETPKAPSAPHVSRGDVLALINQIKRLRQERDDLKATIAQMVGELTEALSA